MRLLDLKPELQPMPTYGTHFLRFLCPKCQAHQVAVEVWPKASGEQPRQYGEFMSSARIWHAAPLDLASISVTPSIGREGCGDPCGGWHGHVTNGEIT
jgi:hypothetical protein